MKNMDKKRICLGLFFLGLGLFYLYQTYLFKLSFPLEEGTLHPMSMPRFLLVIWCVLCVLYIIVPRKSIDLSDLIPELPRLGLICSTIILFIVGIQYVGFIVSGIVMLLAIFWILEYRTKLSMIIAVGSVIGLYCLFVYAMKIPLPSCVLF